MVTPNEQKKEDAEVYPVIVLDPNGNEYTKGSPCTPLCDGTPKALSFPKLPDT